MKLYCEELETKIKDIEEAKHQVVISTKKTILELKRDNQQLIEKLKKLADSSDNKSINIKKNGHHLPLNNADGSSYISHSARDKIGDDISDNKKSAKESVSRLTEVGIKGRE